MPAGIIIREQQLARFMNEGFLLVEASDSIQRGISEVFTSGAEFFRESNATKMLSRLEDDTGYRPYGVEYSQSPTRPDQIESFTVSYRIPPSQVDSVPGNARHLYKRMLGLFDIFESAAERLTIEIADRITGTSHADILRSGFHTYSVLQLNLSRPAHLSTDYVHELHEDGSLLTMSSVTGPGFELQANNGSFLPLTPSGAEILLISGEILWLLSGGKVRPVYHRVQPVSSCEERMSLLFFADLRPRLCVPWVKNKVNENVDIAERVLKNSTRFGLSEWRLLD